ncbi:MAG: hypothetical protein HUU60_10580 [Armatimonadetes bacterium]|nr:hypothetical protein [Armatimonadota bacterium]
MGSPIRRNRLIIGGLLVGCAAFALATWLESGLAVVLLLTPWLSLFFVPQQHWRLVSVLLFVKLAMVGVVTVLTNAVWGSPLIPVNPDQAFYLSTAERIRSDLSQGIEPDYQSIIMLHNRLYNILIGWLAYFNGSSDPFMFRLLNMNITVITALGIFWLARRVYPSNELAHTVALIGGLLLPSANVYAMFVLRDVMIAMSVVLFSLALVRKDLLLGGIVMFVSYHLRFQLPFVMAGTAIVYLWVSLFYQKKQPSRAIVLASFAGFAAIGFVAAKAVLPQVAYVDAALSLDNVGAFLVRMIPSVLGLDFFFADTSRSEVSASFATAMSWPMALATRIVMPDSFIVPLLFVWHTVANKRGMANRTAFLLAWSLWFFIGIYAFGYWIEYQAQFLRLVLPFYPPMLALVSPYIAAFIEQRQKRDEPAPAPKPAFGLAVTEVRNREALR